MSASDIEQWRVKTIIDSVDKVTSSLGKNAPERKISYEISKEIERRFEQKINPKPRWI